MTTSRSLSWIDRGRWESLLSAATDTKKEPDQATLTRQPRPAGAVPPARKASAASSQAVALSQPPGSPGASAGASAGASRVASVPAVPPIPAPAPAAPVKKVYPPYESSGGHLDERLQSLMAWIEGNATCTAAFVADDNGLPVIEHHAAEQSHIAAASSILMMLSSVRSLASDSGGWLTLKMSSAVLHVVEVTTRWGRFAIGVVAEDLLPHEFLSALSAAVESAFHGETSQGEST